MICIKQDAPNCFVVAAACVMEASVADLNIPSLHVVSNEPYPECLRGAHPTDIVQAGLRLGFACILLTRTNYLEHTEKVAVSVDLEKYIRKYAGVIITSTHCYAWDTVRCWDPNGAFVPLPTDIEHFMIIISLQKKCL